jgi:hypothetical protein
MKSIAIRVFIAELQLSARFARLDSRRLAESPIIWRLGLAQMPEDWTEIRSIANFVSAIQAALLPRTLSAGMESLMCRTSPQIEHGTARLLSAICVIKSSDSLATSISTLARQLTHKSCTTAPRLDVGRSLLV